jgi:hypothetical protein
MNGKKMTSVRRADSMNGKKLIAIEVEFDNLHFARIPFEYVGVLQFIDLERIEYTTEFPRNKDKNDPEYSAKQSFISIDRNCAGEIVCLFTDDYTIDKTK